MNKGPRHQCAIYAGSPLARLPLFAQATKERLTTGYRCLYLNDPDMVVAFTQALEDAGVDTVSEKNNNRLQLSSEPVTRNGDFDIDYMLGNLQQAHSQAMADGMTGLWATGDMKWELGDEKNYDKLPEYEMKLDALLQQRQGLCGICQYAAETLPPSVMRQGLLMHRMIYINNTVTRLNPHYQPGIPTSARCSNPALDDLLHELYLS